MPQVTVILPTWNRAKWLRTSIESVLSQTFRDFELIVVDDGSTDCTNEILDTFAGKIKTIVLPQNLGVSAARNAAIKQSDGEWIAFLDSDDFGMLKNWRNRLNKPDFVRNITFISQMKSGSETEQG